jgi:hypothetical protein
MVIRLETGEDLQVFDRTKFFDLSKVEDLMWR